MTTSSGYLNFDVDPLPAVTESYRESFESAPISATDFRNSVFEREIQILARQSTPIASNEGTLTFSEDAAKEALYVFRALAPEVPKPHLVWLEDGGLSFEWQKAKGKILSAAFYGDGYVVWGALLGIDGFIKSISTRIFCQGTRRRSPGVQFLLDSVKEYFM